MPFTVFAKPRPIRIAFFLQETEEFDSALDGLASWSSKFWGGRQSAVALLDNRGTLSTDTWQELIRFDPDHIYSFASLSDALLAKLDDELLPWCIRESRSVKSKAKDKPKQGASEALLNPEIWIEEHIEAPAVAVPPTEKNLHALGKHPLLLFHFDKSCPLMLRRFVHRNFGTYDQWFDLRSGEPRSLGWLEDLLAKTPVNRFRVDDLPSLCSALQQISGTPFGRDYKPALAFTAPCELTSAHLPRSFPHGTFGHTYRVVVGSTLRDFVLYWRSCLNEGDGVWHSPFRHCLWIPRELISEAAFVAALKNWLYHFTGQGSSGSHDVEVTSVSASQADMSPLFDTSRSGLHCFPTRFVAAGEIEARWQRERVERGDGRLMTGLSGGSAERLVAVESNQTRELQPPAVIQPEAPAGTWAVDVQVEREKGEDGSRDSWWSLPRRSGRDVAGWIFRCPARVSRSGLFAVRVERSSTWPGTQSPARIQVQLPAEREVLHSLLIQRGSWFDYDDARHERIQIKRAVAEIQISDAGRKLRGLIDLFGGFWRARDYAERTFWQETFYRMAGRGARYDTNFQTETAQTIAKEVKKFAGALPEPDRNKLAERITNRLLARVGQRLLGVPLTAVEMENDRARLEKDMQSNPQAAAKLLQYSAGDTLVHMSGVTPVTREQFEEGLQDLVELSVMRMGMSVTCPRCRMKPWIEVERLKQAGMCPGCGSAMPLVTETPWSYTLNPLVHHCVNHRMFAVWQALSYLSPRFGSFFYTPSSELHFTQPINDDSKREVDVLCVTDGELLLGEVKTGGLHEKDFLDFAAISAAIRPDRAAIFIELDQFGANTKKWFGQFRHQLEPLGINGQLFCLPNY